MRCSKKMLLRHLVCHFMRQFIVRRFLDGWTLLFSMFFFLLLLFICLSLHALESKQHFEYRHFVAAILRIAEWHLKNQPDKWTYESFARWTLRKLSNFSVVSLFLFFCWPISALHFLSVCLSLLLSSCLHVSSLDSVLRVNHGPYGMPNYRFDVRYPLCNPPPLYSYLSICHVTVVVNLRLRVGWVMRPRLK